MSLGVPFTLLHRVAWGLVLVATVLGLTHLVIVQQNESNDEGTLTVTSVAETSVDTSKFPFPTITICPASNIMTGVAHEYLKPTLQKYWGLPLNSSQEASLLKLLRSLQGLRFPENVGSDWDVDEHGARLLHYLDVRALMLAASPRCKGFFKQCTWKGKPVDCCDGFFKVQETDWGFCYSYNSCTALETKGGPCKPEPGIYDGDEGLRFVVSLVNRKQILLDDATSRGITVIVSNPYEIPYPSNGVYVSDLEDNIVDIRVSLSALDADSDLRAIPWEKRGCKFRDELSLDLSHYYSQQSCIATCRLNAMLKKCQCLPYFYSIKSKGTPLGRVNSVPLEPEERVALQLLQPDAERLDCECPTECELLLYDVDVIVVGTAECEYIDPS